MKTTIEIANTIISQLGGHKFFVMTGAKSPIALDSGLQVNLPRNKTGGNKLRVTLTAEDLYDVEFFSVRGAKVASKASADGLSVEQMRAFFESETGFYLTF